MGMPLATLLTFHLRKISDEVEEFKEARSFNRQSVKNRHIFKAHLF